MTERWVSNARYFCKICEVWMADNKSSRSMHENGNNHKANVQRKISGSYNKMKEADREKAELKKELDRIENAARLAMTDSVTAAASAPTSGSALSGHAAPSIAPAGLAAAVPARTGRGVVAAAAPTRYVAPEMTEQDQVDELARQMILAEHQKQQEDYYTQMALQQQYWQQQCLAAGFTPCATFEGSRPGYVFTTGHLGTGYYLDYHGIPDTPVDPATAKTTKADGTETEEKESDSSHPFGSWRTTAVRRREPTPEPDSEKDSDKESDEESDKESDKESSSKASSNSSGSSSGSGSESGGEERKKKGGWTREESDEEPAPAISFKKRARPGQGNFRKRKRMGI